MNKPVIRSYTVIRNGNIGQLTKQGVAEVHLIDNKIDEVIEGIPYRIGEGDVTIICRAVLNAEHQWNFPWWWFTCRARLREFREYYKWGTRI